MEGEHWKKSKLAGYGRAGSYWIAELLDCPFYFAVKEVSHSVSHTRLALGTLRP